jgi:hypothetical protein
VYWSNETNEALPAPDIDPFAEEIRYFVQCCKSGQKPDRCPPSESALAVRAARMMVQAREKKGEKVKFDEASAVRVAD